MNVNINITHLDGSCYTLETQDHIKYLGVMIDSTLTWKYHISYVCAKLSRNTGVYILITLRRSIIILSTLTFHMLLLPGAALARPIYIKYKLSRIISVIRVILFVTLSGKNTDSALPLLNIFKMLTVANVYRLDALKFVYAWHKGVLPEFLNHFFQYASNVHNYNTRYAAKQNLHKFRVNTIIGKQMISFMSINLWQELSYKFKDLNQFAFSKSVKNYILSQQYQT